MMAEPEKSLNDIIREDGRYPTEAYAFLQESLAKAVKDVHGDKAGPGGQSHVTGRQLCEAARDLALERWGYMAKAVLAKWHIAKTIDFGNMVYLLIKHNQLRKTDEDSIEDFRDVYDFAQAFGRKKTFELRE